MRTILAVLALALVGCGEPVPGKSSSSGSSTSSGSSGSSSSSGGTTGCSETWYPDRDGDGYGDDRSPTTACSRPAGYVAAGGDCDDSSTWVHPGADFDIRPASSLSTRQPFDLNCNGQVEEESPTYRVGDSNTCYMSGLVCVSALGGAFVLAQPAKCGDSVQVYFCQAGRSSCTISAYGTTQAVKRCR